MKLRLNGELYRIKMMFSNERPKENIWEIIINLTNDEILYIENYNRNTLIYTEDGEYLITSTFSVVKKIFEKDERFKYSHCSYLVNIEKVSSINNTEVVLSGYKKRKIPLTKRRKQEFWDAYEKYGKGYTK